MDTNTNMNTPETRERTARENLVDLMTDRLIDWIQDQVEVENAACDYAFKILGITVGDDIDDKLNDIVNKTWEYRQSILLDVVANIARVKD